MQTTTAIRHRHREVRRRCVIRLELTTTRPVVRRWRTALCACCRCCGCCAAQRVGQCFDWLRRVGISQNYSCQHDTSVEICCRHTDFWSGVSLRQSHTQTCMYIHSRRIINMFIQTKDALKYIPYNYIYTSATALQRDAHELYVLLYGCVHFSNWQKDCYTNVRSRIEPVYLI